MEVNVIRWKDLITEPGTLSMGLGHSPFSPWLDEVGLIAHLQRLKLLKRERGGDRRSQQRECRAGNARS